MVAVKSNHASPRLIEPLSELMRRKSLSIECTTVNIQAEKTFHVRITNHSDEDRY